MREIIINNCTCNIVGCTHVDSVSNKRLLAQTQRGLGHLAEIDVVNLTSILTSKRDHEAFVYTAEIGHNLSQILAIAATTSDSVDLSSRPRRIIQLAE